MTEKKKPVPFTVLHNLTKTVRLLDISFTSVIVTGCPNECNFSCHVINQVEFIMYPLSMDIFWKRFKC